MRSKLLILTVTLAVSAMSAFADALYCEHRKLCSQNRAAH